MRIPLHTVKPRFYVATTMSKAYSSWASLEDARHSYRLLGSEDRGKVIGVVEVYGVSTTKHTVTSDG